MIISNIKKKSGEQKAIIERVIHYLLKSSIHLVQKINVQWRVSMSGQSQFEQNTHRFDKIAKNC